MSAFLTKVVADLF